jgi:pimeloyl-ACP methyl ester carboxylesterase
MTRYAQELDVIRARVTSFDDTVIAVRHLGAGPALPLLVVNAVGANLGPWRLTLERLAPEGPIVMWDHRGMFESGPPSGERVDTEAHALDALAVMDHLGYEQFVIASWSSGGRIALEIAHRFGERVAALALVSAGQGYALTRFLRYFELPSLLPLAAGVARRFASPLGGALHGLLGRPELAGLVRQAGMTSASADIGSLVELVRGLGDSDMGILLATYEKVVGDPAWPLLPQIAVPTLLVAGVHDQFAPRRMTEEMATAIPGAELIFYEDATHYLPMEYPELLADDLSSFFARAV